MSTDINVMALELRPFIKRSVTTAIGNPAGTTLIDAGLTEPNNFWNGMAILIRTGDCAGELRRVTGWVLATNTLTVNVAFSAQIVTGVQYVMLYPVLLHMLPGGGFKADLQQVLGQGADIALGNELLTDPSDRAARLLGVIYGSQAQQLQQYAGTFEALVREYATRSDPTTLVNNITFDNVTTTYTSAALDCLNYRKFILLVHKTVAANPTTLEIQVQYSVDGVNWYHYTRGPFGYLAWEDTAGTEDEGIDGEVPARYLRLYVIATGTTAVNMFTLTAAIQLIT